VKAAIGELRPELLPAPQPDEVVGVLLEEREIRLVLEMLRPLSAFGAGAEAIVKVVVDLRPGEVDYLALRVADATMK
jgi:hypothetical protein